MHPTPRELDKLLIYMLAEAEHGFGLVFLGNGNQGSLTVLAGLVCYFKASSSSWQARSQTRQARSQTRQCS